MPESEPLKDDVIKCRVEGAFKLRVKNAFTNYGVAESTLVRDGVEAILDYIERGKGYRRPIAVVHDNRTEEEKLMVAEAGAKYGGKGKKH